MTEIREWNIQWVHKTKKWHKKIYNILNFFLMLFLYFHCVLWSQFSEKCVYKRELWKPRYVNI